MKYPDENFIERYVRNPEGLTDAEQAAVADMLESSAAARAVEAMLRDFYAEFDDQPEDLRPEAEAFLDRLFPPAVIIPLHPFRAPAPPGSRRTMILAAASPAADAPGLEPLAALASPEEDVVLRILRRYPENTGHVYLLAGAAGRRSYAVISFPELSLEVVTDERGRVDFDLGDLAPARWADVHAVLHLPVAAATLDADRAREEPYLLELPSGHRVSFRYADEHLRIVVSVPEGGPAPLTRVLLECDGRFTLGPVYDGRADFALVDPPDQVTLRFYE